MALLKNVEGKGTGLSPVMSSAFPVALDREVRVDSPLGALSPEGYSVTAGHCPVIVPFVSSWRSPPESRRHSRCVLTAR